MRSTLLFVLAITFSINVFASDSLNINYGGLMRGFWVHVPPTYTAGQHLPMVFNFHGYGSFASQQELYTQMDNVADTGNFIIVYPSGINAAWNVGWVGSFWTGPDDVGFTSAIIDTMIKLYTIDSTRVYSCGMSNGGFMSHLLASVLSSRITAIAAVSGTLTDSAVANCLLTRKVPVMDIHGTNDPVVNYSSFMASLNVEQTIAFWVGQDVCGTTPDTTFVPNIDVADSSTVQKIDYPSCATGAEVLFYKIINGGHTWPNGIIDIPVASYGYTNRDIDANTEIWHFFNKYKINTTTGISELIEKGNEIQISPNPLSGNLLQITLDNPIGDAQVQIMDANGRVVFKSEMMGQSNGIKLNIPNSLSAGVYLVQIISAKGELVRKLVKL
jgi:polyhydroxybutyrate depolymerase